MSEVDVDGMAAEAEPSRQQPIFLFALLQRVWQNGVWHERVYKWEIWQRISLCGKNPTRWYSLTLTGCIQRSNSGCKHSQTVMRFSSRGSDVWDKLCSERSGTAANAKNKSDFIEMSGQSWWLCRKKAFCCWGLEDCIGLWFLWKDIGVIYFYVDKLLALFSEKKFKASRNHNLNFSSIASLYFKSILLP